MKRAWKELVRGWKSGGNQQITWSDQVRGAMELLGVREEDASYC